MFLTRLFVIQLWQDEKEADCQTEEDRGDHSSPGVCGGENNTPQNI